MSQNRIAAAFMRGGTSKALVFHLRDLPPDRQTWNDIFLRAMGSPDPHGRQLDGMGGGVTSLSKVCVVGPPSRADADIDYSFFQVLIREARVSAFGNCGNMSAAMGPFALDEGLVCAQGDSATVRIHNTNTGKIIRSTFAVRDGAAETAGELVIPGVAGSGSCIRLEFLDPGGAGTGRLLPTGRPADVLHVGGIGPVEVSIVDAANPCVFVEARSVGLGGTELPEALERCGEPLARLHAIGAEAVRAMGLSEVFARAGKKLPLIAVVSAPQDAPMLSGGSLAAADMDLCLRVLSNGQPHRALPVTGAVCTAVAAHIAGTLPCRLIRRQAAGRNRRLAMPSGVLEVDAQVVERNGLPHAEAGTLLRSARRLFDGFVYY